MGFDLKSLVPMALQGMQGMGGGSMPGGMQGGMPGQQQQMGMPGGMGGGMQALTPLISKMFGVDMPQQQPQQQGVFQEGRINPGLMKQMMALRGGQQGGMAAPMSLDGGGQQITQRPDLADEAAGIY